LESGSLGPGFLADRANDVTLSLNKLVYLDGRQAVLYRSRMNPFLGRNFEATDPLEWLARNPPQDKPPPVREILRVAEQGEGWGVPANWE
jgi:hypothetical protein